MDTNNDILVEDLSEILDIWLDSRLRRVHTILPGKIVEYDYTTRKAKVKPLIKMKMRDNTNLSIDPIDNVPVLIYGTNKANIYIPIKKDDGVLLLFSESPMGNYLNSTTEQEADDLRRFNLADCIAIPGLWSFKSVPTAPDNGNDFFINFQDAKITIKDKTNDIIIETTTGKIKIEKSGNITFNDGTESYVKGNTLANALLALCTTISTATSGTPAQNAAGIETIKTAFSTFNAQINNFKSTQIKGV